MNRKWMCSTVLSGMMLLLAITAQAKALEPELKPYNSLSVSDQAVLKKLGVVKQAALEKAEVLKGDSSAGFDFDVAKVRINSDTTLDYVIRFCGGAYYGLAGCQVSVYTSTSQQRWVLAAPGTPALAVAFPGSRHLGYLDLYYEGPGLQKPVLWRWDGRGYNIRK